MQVSADYAPLNPIIKMPNGDVIRSWEDYEAHLEKVVQDAINRIVVEKVCLYWWERLALRIGLAWC